LTLSTVEYRTTANPLFNDNRFKLGIFAANVSNGAAITLAEGRLETTWPNTRAIATLADQAGIEALVPVGRWKGFGGPSNFNGSCFETYTWAAGIAEATRQSAVFSTSHVPTVHPIMAAKQATTIDHISGGRFALNIVCGWFQPELEMFGAPIMEHDARYDYATEWLAVVKGLWSAEDEFDFEGRFFKIDKGFHEPKPLQQPFPPIMNAGGSPVGQRWAAKHADLAFVALEKHDFETAKARVDALRSMARDEFQRDVRVWNTSYVVCRPTEKEATDYLNYYVRERGDWEAVENLVRIFGLQSLALPKEVLEEFKFHFIAGWGGFPLVGTPEQIVDKLQMLARAGIDGTVLSWVNYLEELPQWVNEVMPLMVQAGLRRPVAAHARA
jgi:alkanesulfonate monooxygenase SsuD/methylene tetrahydromethanopterin reductase-like flavin-dependent oxidoreductase (luciferase family)